MNRINLKLQSLFFSVLFLATITSAQVLKENQPEKVGMSSERLEKLDDFIQKYIDEKKVPGGVFLVARKGNIVYNKSFGTSNDQKKAYNKNDIFRIASMTKAITTVSIMQLYEQGELGLDEPVSKYIPAFKNQQVLDSFNKTDSSYTTVKTNRPVTIRHLLTHTSGISYGGFNPGEIQIIYNKFQLNEVGLSHPTWSTEEMANRIAKAPLVFQPGEKFMYGLNMDVLGRVIEVISGVGLDEYFKQNIFEPLGMEDTYFYLPENKHSRLVPVYNQTKEGFILAKEKSDFGGLNYPKAKGLTNFAGGGGLSSTALDYARLIQALVNNGQYNGFQLLGRNTIEVMSSDQMIELNKRGTGYSKTPGLTYGLGFALRTKDAKGLSSKSPGTYEWGGYFNTKFFIDPQEELIFVGMTQIVPFYYGDFWNKMYALIYGSIVD
ncbi:MAG: beta-lactamase family protein [Bacteroidetes bacterium]|nr:beta-lactamase family protein [Bacteroidota bacterium]